MCKPFVRLTPIGGENITVDHRGGELTSHIYMSLDNNVAVRREDCDQHLPHRRPAARDFRTVSFRRLAMQ